MLASQSVRSFEGNAGCIFATMFNMNDLTFESFSGIARRYLDSHLHFFSR